MSEVDPTIPLLPTKDIVFRIFRDIRFSNDKTPFKPNFAAAWSRTGRKGPYAHYYLHIQPNGKTFLGGGIWHATAEQLTALRRSIDRHPRAFKQILNDPDFEKLFEGMRGLLKTDDKLKRAPKIYSIDHPDIELLKLKTFTVGLSIEDDNLVCGEGFLDIVESMFTVLCPFITKLNDITMPDLGSDYHSDTPD